MWNLDRLELPESAFSLHTTRYSNFYFFNYTCFINFYQSVSLGSFIPEADCSFLGISKYDIYIGIGILRGQKWQKWFRFRYISKFQLVLLENYSCDFLYQFLNLRFHTSTWLLLWRICAFVPYIGLNSSIKISIDNFCLSKMRFSLNSIVVCSIYNFCAALMENIELWLRRWCSFNLIIFKYWEFSRESKFCLCQIEFMPKMAHS